MSKKAFLVVAAAASVIGLNRSGRPPTTPGGHPRGEQLGRRQLDQRRAPRYTGPG